jgi:hypothetical protein
MARDRTYSFVAIALGIGAWVLPGAIIWLSWNPAAKQVAS